MKKYFPTLAALMLSACLWAETINNVHYLDANGEEQIIDNVTVVTSSDKKLNWVSRETAWYVVTDDVTLSQGVTCKSDVRLILGGKLTVTGGEGFAGIQVSGTGSLTIYQRIGCTGTLEAIGSANTAGIGGIYGGSGSNITINGGTIIATGGTNAAGIGGGGDTGSGSNITINGGTVIANGGDYAAGIGGGNKGSGSNITINGGNVTANGGTNAAGIGGGNNGSATNININAGTVTACGGEGAPGIGGGYGNDDSHDIYVSNLLLMKAGNSANPGDEIALSEEDLAELLADKRYVSISTPAPVSVTYISHNGDEQTVSARVINNFLNRCVLKTGWYVVNGRDIHCEGIICNGNVNLIIADGAKLTTTGGNGAAGIQISGEDQSITIYGQTAQSGKLIANGGGMAAGIGGGGEDENDDGNKGINITINGADVTATGGFRGAGIGGGNFGSGSNITINAGKVTAYGGDNAAAIGGGYDGNASNITINGGMVVATGNDAAAAIGGKEASSIFVADNMIIKAGTSANPTTIIADSHTSTTDVTTDLAGKKYVTIEMNTDISVTASYIDINGVEQTVNAKQIIGTPSTLTAGWYIVKSGYVSTGTITCNGAVNIILADGAKLTATGDYYSNAPGIRVSGSGNSLTVYGQTAQSGQLIAKGGNHAAGIGGGMNDNGSNITINGGTVTATGDEDAAGIGGGYNGSGSNITINGGNVTATGGEDAAGIGGGWKGSASNITINAGKVTATGGVAGAGIGCGDNSATQASGIFVATNLIIKADNNSSPVDLIAVARTSTTDIASYLAGKQYVTIVPDPLPIAKAAAIAAINGAINEADNENVKAIAANAVTAINKLETVYDVDMVKTFVLSAIASARAAFAEGKDKPFGIETSGPAVEIKKGDKVYTIYNPEQVTYLIKQE